jgi:hypothetical protein
MLPWGLFFVRSVDSSLHALEKRVRLERYIFQLHTLGGVFSNAAKAATNRNLFINTLLGSSPDVEPTATDLSDTQGQAPCCGLAP